ncbi:MAG: AsnC family transcriptional regulator [Halobacteriota archaeon]|jgi:DNA-binding Lrp family transcriptional regulator
MRTFDAIDSRLINLLQYEFPLAKEPFNELAARLDTPEDEILARIRRLKAKGVIREIGPIFNSKMIGLVSTLVALRVPENAVDVAAQIINSYAGVTHNYEREGEYNIWFTLAAASDEALASTLEEIKGRIHPLSSLVVPVKRILKLKTNFKL